jgi:hypothetical protein
MNEADVSVCYFVSYSLPLYQLQIICADCVLIWTVLGTGSDDTTFSFLEALFWTNITRTSFHDPCLCLYIVSDSHTLIFVENLSWWYRVQKFLVFFRRTFSHVTRHSCLVNCGILLTWNFNSFRYELVLTINWQAVSLCVNDRTIELVHGNVIAW